MSREQRGPNEKLGTVLALAGISNAGLARRVNDLGAQRGLTLRYDKTSVARWVSKGMVPQGAAPHLIAAAIGSKLGRPVPLHEIGLADADPAPEVGPRLPARRGRGGEVGHRAVPARSGRAAARRRRHLAVAGRLVRGERVRDARLPLADNPGRQLGRTRPGDGASSTRRRQRTACRRRPGSGGDEAPPLRVGHSDVAKLREAAEDARRWDSKYGGGDWRSSMVPGVPAGGRGTAAARRVHRRGGPRAVRRDRRTDPARRVDGLRHRPAGGGAALLHPGAAAGPRRRRRTARRLRPGVDVAPGDLPRLRRRGRRPRPGRRWNATAGWPPPAP